MSYTQRPRERTVRGACALLALAACSRDPLPSGRAGEPRAGRSVAPGELAAATRALAAAAAAVGPDDVLLDVRSDGAALAGRVEPPVPDGDPLRVIGVRWMAQGRAVHWRFEGARLLDARFVPGRAGAVVLTTARELVWLEAPQTLPVVLDHDVAGPLAVARGGRYVAYVRGEAPELELFRYDLEARRAEAITRAMAPTWAPALSADGREILFVSGASGSPALYRAVFRSDTGTRGAAATADIRRVADSEPSTPLPQGPGAPVWLGGALVYEEAGALRVLGDDGRARKRLPSVQGPVGVVGAEAVVARAASGAPTLLWPPSFEAAP